MYCFYKYYLSYSKSESKPIYLYLAGIFSGICVLVHPISLFHSAIGVLVLYVFLFIKHRKLALNWKHISVGALLFLILFMVFFSQTFNILSSLMKRKAAGHNEQADTGFSRLFQWSLDPARYSGAVPPIYFSFGQMHGKWTLPFLVFGVVFLLLRRKDQDLFLLAWLVGLYLVLHRDLFGIDIFLHRSLSASAHIFAPLTAIGAVYVGTFISSITGIKKEVSHYLKYIFAGIFIYFAISVNMASASESLNKNTYNHPLLTLNDAELEAAQWVLENVDEAYNTSLLGIPHTPEFLSATAKKIRWFAAVAERPTRFYYLLSDEVRNHNFKNDYLILDYTMLVALQNQEPFAGLLKEIQSFEQNDLVNHTLLYDKNYIKVYKLETEN